MISNYLISAHTLFIPLHMYIHDVVYAYTYPIGYYIYSIIVL